MSFVDVFSKYYAFDKLPQSNKYYSLKKENYQLAKKLYLNGDIEVKAFPIRTTIQTTDLCNLNCIMCQIHSQREKHKLQFMKKDDFDIVVEKLFPYLIEIHPTNIGEPLCSDWFEYFLDKVIEYGVLLDITTNGTLLNERKIYKIFSNLLDIKISFDGIEKETFEKIRKGADFNIVVENIDKLLKAKAETKSNGTITLQMTLFNFNYRELLGVIKFAKDKGIDRVKAYHLFSHSKELNDLSLVNNLEQFEEIRVSAINLAKNLNIALEISEPPINNGGTKNLICQKCRLPWAECWIDSDGKVYPCHSHNYSALGNIYGTDFYSIWNSEYTKVIRKSLLNNNIESICNNCGMNFLKYDENQPVPYDKDGYLYNIDRETKQVRWSSRSKQFLIRR